MLLKKMFFICLGTLSLGMGIIGIFVPLLPTTPFILLTAYLYARSSPQLYKLLLTNKVFGKYLDNYRQGRGIPLITKIISISLLWLSILYSNFFLIEIVLLKAIFSYTAMVVTVHILGNKTIKVCCKSPINLFTVH
jgi:uncharacterized protein